MIRTATAMLLATMLAACANPDTEAAGETGKRVEEEPCVVESERDPDAFCTQQYDPVCGCNDKSYGNACMARIDGVQRWTPGRCGEPPPEV